jgi:hypothetical protein
MHMRVSKSQKKKEIIKGDQSTRGLKNVEIG